MYWEKPTQLLHHNDISQHVGALHMYSMYNRHILHFISTIIILPWPIHSKNKVQGCMKDLSHQALSLILDISQKQQWFRQLIFKYVQLGLNNIPVVHWGIIAHPITSVTTSVQEYMDSELSSSWVPFTVLKISFELCGDSIYSYERDNILGYKLYEAAVLSNTGIVVWCAVQEKKRQTSGYLSSR